jgi:adenylate cyclase
VTCAHGPRATAFHEHKRVFVQLFGRMCTAHLLGALAVFLYLAVSLGPGAAPGQSQDVGLELAIFATVIVATFALVFVLSDRSWRAATHGGVKGREPTEHERVLTLNEPWRQALIPFVGWAVAAVVYATLSIVGGDPALHTLRMFDGIILGGLTTCALGYLLVERSFRPLFAVALAGEPPDRPRTLGVRPRLLLSWAVSSGVPLLAIALAPFTHEPGARFGLGTSVAVLAVIGLKTGVFATWLAATSIAEPVDDVRDAMWRVAGGDLAAEVKLDDGGEIGMLQGGFNRMVAGLRERERLRDLFGRHVGDEVARHAMEAPTGLGGEQRDASVLFVDLIGSTALAEVLPPEGVVETLNAFFATVVDAVSAVGGWVNKFEGDGALCIFGAPAVQPDHAARALRAARAVRDGVVRLRATHPGLDAGVGVSSGAVVAGNVGTEQRYEYTVIGAPVNEAARLSELAKGHPGRVLAAGSSIERAGARDGEPASWVGRGTVALRGRAEPTAIHEPVPAGAEPAEIG